MHALRVPLLLCLAALTYGLPGTEIVGGKDAPAGMFPYQVSLRKGEHHFCGGSIINSRYVLTAAHCVDGTSDTKSIKVHAGTNRLNSDGTAYGVAKIIVHRNYDSIRFTNDIALIRVDRDIAFNSAVKAIPLASGSKTYEGSSCILSGWGRLQANGNVPNNLQYIDLVVEKQLKCKLKQPKVIDSHICTFTKYGEGACYGDSGSPLVANGVQIGFASFVVPCGVGFPDVYTRVSSFASWIKNQQAYVEGGEVGESPADAIYIS